jgi:hypothetical protein
MKYWSVSTVSISNKDAAGPRNEERGFIAGAAAFNGSD